MACYEAPVYTDELPSHAEAKARIAASMQAINLICDEIQACESEERIAQLSEQRNRLESLILTLQSIVAPIRSIPVEVLGDIFAHTTGPEWLLPTENFGDVQRAMRPLHRGPQLLTHVCRRWRNVAINHAKLW